MKARSLFRSEVDVFPLFGKVLLLLGLYKTSVKKFRKELRNPMIDSLSSYTYSIISYIDIYTITRDPEHE